MRGLVLYLRRLQELLHRTLVVAGSRNLDLNLDQMRTQKMMRRSRGRLVSVMRSARRDSRSVRRTCAYRVWVLSRKPRSWPGNTLLRNMLAVISISYTFYGSSC